MIVYEVDKKKGSKGSFTGLVNYLTNSKGLESRVGEIALNNFLAEDVRVACMEAAATQMMNTRAKSDKTLHLVMSFPAGEKPSSDVLKECEEIVVKKLGMTEYQRVSVVHGDTDNLHVHIVINKIHPKTKNIFEPYQSHKKLAKACVECEDKFNLIKDNHEFIKNSVENRIDKLEIHKGEESLCSSVRKIKDELSKAANWEEFHQILYRNKCGIKIRANGFVFYDYTGVHVKASTVDRSFSKKKLEDKFGAFIPFDTSNINKHDSSDTDNDNAANGHDSSNEQQIVTDQNQVPEDDENNQNVNDNLNQNEEESEEKLQKKKPKRKAEKNPAEPFQNPEQQSLWSEYQKNRIDSHEYNKKVKKDVYKYLFELNKKNFNKIRLQYKVFSMLKIPRFMRSYLNLYLSMKVRRMREEAKAAAKHKLEKLTDAKQSWLCFLKNKAEDGNLEALNILLYRNSKDIGTEKRGNREVNKSDFSMLKKLIQKHMHLEKITSNGNAVYVYKNKTIVVTGDRIFVNRNTRNNGYRFKKSRNSHKYSYPRFDKQKNKHGYKYRNFKDDFAKTDKLYDYIKEELKKRASDEYRKRTEYAKMRNRKKIEEYMRSQKNRENNQKKDKRGITL